MTPLELVLFFLAWLIAGSLFILGFFTVTRDGEIGGMWERYFDEHTTRYPQIKEQELLDKYIALEAMEPDIYNKLLFDEMGHSLKKLEVLSNIEERKIEIVLGVLVEQYRDYVYLRNIEYEYFHSWKVRKMAGCPICMSGWLGSIVFLLGLVVLNFKYIFFPLPFYAGPVIWVAYCVSLAFVNKAIMTKFDS